MYHPFYFTEGETVDKLVLSARNGDLKSVKYYINSGDINLALRNASYMGHLDIVQYLIYNGAYSGKALIDAAEYGQLDIVKYLSKLPEYWDQYDMALGFAARNGHLNVVRYLVGGGKASNSEGIHWRDDWALRWASAKGHLPVVAYLLEEGANINAHNNGALRWAAQFGHRDVFRYLIEADISTSGHQFGGNGANIDLAIVLAAKYGFSDIVQDLLNYI